MLLQLFVDNTRPAMAKTSLDFVFFYLVNQNLMRSGAFFAFSPLHLSEPLTKQKVLVCDLWLVDFDTFCVFLCFKVSCFVFERHRKFYLSSKLFLTSLHWNMASLDSKGEIVSITLSNPEETQLPWATERWKRTGTFPLTFTFADKHSGCYGNGLIDVAEKFEFGACSIWIVEDLGRGSFLFPTYLGRSKETLFAGYGFPGWLAWFSLQIFCLNNKIHFSLANANNSASFKRKIVKNYGFCSFTNNEQTCEWNCQRFRPG